MLPLVHRATDGPVIPTGPGVPYNAFMGVQWAGAGFSVAFLVVRLVARWRGPRRIFWDDVCAALAAIIVLVNACLWQWTARDMYYVLDLQAGLAPVEADFADRLVRELTVSGISEIFFYASLLLVKLSFILFFKRLGNYIPGQNWVRLPAFALSVICFAVSVGDMGFSCLFDTDILYLSTYCVSPEFNTKMTNAVTANCVLDVVSDIAITIIPFTLLWNTRIQTPKKLAIAGLFSLTVVTIALAIARAIVINVTKKANGLQDPSYVWMWGTIQASIAIIVSCLSAFPQLFAASARNIKPQWTPTASYYQRLRSRMQKGSAKSTDPLYDISAITFNHHDDHIVKHSPSCESQHPILRPDSVEVVAAVHYVPGRDASLTAQNQIMRQFQYAVEVSEKPVTEQQRHK